MHYAIVDIGSNTIRLSIFEKKEDSTISLVITKKRTIGLSSYIKENTLSKDGLETLAATLREFKDICYKLDIFSIHFFATGVLRPLKNINEIQQYIWNQVHVTIDIVSGDREAILDQMSNATFHGFHNGILLDIGGSSTELAYFVNDQPVSMVSLPFGSLSLYENYVEYILPRENEVKTIQDVVRKELDKLPDKFPKSINQIIGIGGSLRALLKFENDMRFGEGEGIISMKYLETELGDCPPYTREQIRSFIRLFPDRIHTMIPGVIIAEEVAKKFNCQEISVSRYGIRDGYLLELLKKNNH